MKLNYVLLPENYQPRPRPGYRRLPKKAYEAFTPMSRAGRRVQGKGNVKTAMANNSKKEEEERHGSGFFRFINKLNNNVAARFTYASGKPTSVKAAPVPVMTNNQDGSGYLSSRVRQKRLIADDNKSSSLKAKSERVAKRSRYNPIASSSRVRVEDIPRLRDSTDPVGAAVYNDTYGSNQQNFGGEQYHHHEFPPNPNPVPPHPPLASHAANDIDTPVFPDLVALHQPGQPLWLDAGHAHGFALYNGIEMRNYYHELEHVAIGCACTGMDDEPMDVDAEFPNIIPELNLERLATECAHACLDEPMDTALDDTRGPVYDFLPQEQPVFDPPGFYFPPQQAAQFGPNVMFQQHIFQAQEHEYFIDRLRPPIHAYPIDQQFHFQQADFVINQNFPHQPHFEGNHYLFMEEHHQITPRFDIDHGIQQYADVHIPLPHIVHEEPNDRGFVPYPPGYEEVVNQVHVPHHVDEVVGRNEGILDETVVEARERGDVDNDRVFLGGESGEADNAELFEELFGAEDEEEEEVEIII